MEIIIQMLTLIIFLGMQTNYNKKIFNKKKEINNNQKNNI